MRTHVIRPVLTIAVLIALAAAPALAQSGLVRGKVTDEKGAPVRDAVATFQAEGSQAQRQAKYVWYNERDPGNEREDQYRHLAEIPGARHAPGPAVYVPWDE